jgi:hypothetical protein
MWEVVLFFFLGQIVKWRKFLPSVEFQIRSFSRYPVEFSRLFRKKKGLFVEEQEYQSSCFSFKASRRSG